MSSGFILSSFPVPPTHVPIPSTRYLSTTFLVGGGLDTGASDASGGGLGNGDASDVEIYAGVTHSHLPSHPPSLVSLPIRSRSSSSASSLVSFPAPSLTVPVPVPFPSSSIFPPHLGVAIVPSSGPPPTLPLPPLPAQPSPISPGRQIAFAYSSYSSTKGSARSLRSATSSESLRSIGSMQSQQSQKVTPQYQGAMKRRLDSSQSIQSLVAAGGSAHSSTASSWNNNNNNNSDSDNSSATGRVEFSGTRPAAIGPCTTPTRTQRAERHAESSSSSLMEYEESILDVELDFDTRSSDGDDDDGDRSLIGNSGGDVRINSNEQKKNDNDRVTFPSSSNQKPLPFTTTSSNFNTNSSSSFTSSTSADSNTNLNYYPTTNPKLGSPPTPVQARNRSRSGTLTSVSSKSSLKVQGWQGQNEKGGLKTFNNLVDSSRSNSQKYYNNYNNTNPESSSSSSRIRTYSQPSSSGSSSNIAKQPHSHFHSQSHPAPPLFSYSTRARAVSSVHHDAPSSRTLNIPSYSLVSPSTTSKPPSVSNLSVTKSLQSRHLATAMSAPPSPSASIALPPPTDVTRDHDPPPITPLSSTYRHLSSPNPPSFGSDTLEEEDDDRSTSPDLQSLLSHTSEVLKSGGKVRSSSRPGSRSRSRPRVKSDDRIRTNSTVSAGSKRSVGSGSVGSGRNAAATAAMVSLPTPSRSQPRLHAFGSSRQKSQSRLRSDSKSSLVSKSSTDRFTTTSHSAAASVGSGSSSHTNATAGPSSRASLMDESFDDDRDVFREDDGDTERDREDDHFSFFNPGPSSRHHPQQQHGNVEDDPTLTISFPVMEDDDGEDIIDLKTPLPHLLLRAGVLSPHSKLLPREVGSSDEEDNARGRGRASPVDSLISSTTASSKHPRDARDTAKRRVRHKDGKLLRGGIGLTTGLGWSDSEDEDAPSEFTARLKRLASMGGLSALSRKSSMASNMSSYTGSFSTTTSNLSGFGSVYGSGGGSFSTNGHGHAPSISISQSSSGGRLSSYTTYSTTDNASKRGSMYSEMSVGTGYNGRYVNGSGGTHASGTATPSVSVSASSSRNVSRQSSLSSIPYHQPFNSHHNRKDSEIIEEDEDYSAVTSNKDKERARKTASMVHVDEHAVNRENEKDTSTTMATTSSLARSHSPSRRDRNSTISVYSTSSTHSVQSTESIQSTQSNTLSLNPPSIAGSATPTPGTPTTPTPTSSFSVHEPSPSHVNAPSSHPPALAHPLSTRQPIRLNTSHLSVAARSHSPVPPPSPAPTGPLPPTPGDVLIKGKVGPTAGIGVPATTAIPVTSKSSPTPSSGLNHDDSYSSETIPAAISLSLSSSSSSSSPPSQSQLQKPSTNLTSSSLYSSTSQMIPSSPPPAMSSTNNPARVTSPTPSFSMPTGSRTIHPPRSRNGSLSSSRESSFSISASVKSKAIEGSIGSLSALGGGGGGEEKERGRLPFVVEDDWMEKDETGGGGGQNGSVSQSQALPSPIDPDAIAIVEMEPSEYGDGVAVALTIDEESTPESSVPSENPLFLPQAPTRDESKQDPTFNINIDTHSIPEYPYRFDIPPPSPVISAKNNSAGSFGFKRMDRPRMLQQNSGSSTSSPSLSSGLAKYSVTSPPSVAFSPTSSASRQHEHNASVSSLETSESTASILGGVGRSDHMRMESWNQNFSVFGSGMGVPPPDEVLLHAKPTTISSSRLPSSATKPPMSRNNTYHTPTTSTFVNNIPPSSSSAPSSASSLLSRSASPILARARAASPISSISSMRVGSSLGFASSSSSSSSIPLSSSSNSALNGPSTRRPTTPSSQLGLAPFAQRARGASPVPPSSSNAANTASKLPSASPHQHPPITPAPRKSSLPLPPSFLTSPGRPTSPPPPPPSAAGHMPSLLLRPTQGSIATGTGAGTSAGSVPRKVTIGGIPRPSPSPSPVPISTSKPVVTTPPTPSPLSTSTTKIASTSSIPSMRSSSAASHAMTMLPQPGSGKRVGTPVSRYGSPGIGSGIGKKG